MDVLINISLARPDGLQMAASTALKALRERLGCTHDAARLHVSDSEETIVVRYGHTLAYAKGYRWIAQQVGFVANDLGQDCIAFLYEGKGQLVGPRCATDEFNPTKFLLLDGTRLDKTNA